MNKPTVISSSCGILFGLSLLIMPNAFADMGIQINGAGVFVQSNQHALSIDPLQHPIIYPPQAAETLTGYGFWLPQLSPLPQVRAGSFQRSFQKQRVGIVLDRDRLQQPLMLTISTKGSSVTGNIQINGKTIKPLQGERTSLNIAAYLKPGTNNIAVSGSSRSPQGSVHLELSGHGHHISQQTSGNSQFAQNLTVTVR